MLPDRLRSKRRQTLPSGERHTPGCFFSTGDIVLAEVGKGKKAGRHLGRVAVRDTGRFNIQTLAGVVQGISWKLCKTLQRDDGYGYGLVKPRAAPIQPGNASRHSSRPLKGAGVLPRKL